MPRKKATSPATGKTISAAPAVAEPVEMPEVPAAAERLGERREYPGDAGAEPLRRRSREWKTVTLGPSNADPKMHLLRSYKYRQMQIRFDQDPDDKYKRMLKEAGWRDRTEEEGIWTKQIPKDSGWQPAADAERLFKQIANEMRADKGLGAVLSL